jgi:hypothetical protein
VVMLGEDVVMLRKCGNVEKMWLCWENVVMLGEDVVMLRKMWLCWEKMWLC